MTVAVALAASSPLPTGSVSRPEMRAQHDWIYASTAAEVGKIDDTGWAGVSRGIAAIGAFDIAGPARDLHNLITMETRKRRAVFENWERQGYPAVRAGR